MEPRGYFTERQEMDRKAYISHHKNKLALRGLEYFFALYGEGIKELPTPGQLAGQKMHYAVLERKKFLQNRFVSRFEDFRSAPSQEWRDRVLRENPGAQIMTLNESLKYDRVIDRIMSHPVAGPLISNALRERHGYARCPRTGLMLYSRPDIITDHREIGELKFTRSLDGFLREAYRERYPMQLAFYQAVDNLLNEDQLVNNCFYIAVEFDYPHRLRVIELEPQFEAMGHKDWNYAMDLIKECLDRDPQMKNYEIWRRDSYRMMKGQKPELWMLTNEERYADIIGMS